MTTTPRFRATALSIALHFLAGLGLGWWFLSTWLFGKAEYQIMLLFMIFVGLTLARVGYAKPTRPLAFLLGSVIPYVGALVWLGSLGPKPE